VGKGEGKEHVT